MSCVWCSCVECRAWPCSVDIHCDTGLSTYHTSGPIVGARDPAARRSRASPGALALCWGDITKPEARSAGALRGPVKDDMLLEDQGAEGREGPRLQPLGERPERQGGVCAGQLGGCHGRDAEGVGGWQVPAHRVTGHERLC